MRFGPKAQPSTSVGFEPGIFGSGLEVLTHYTYSNFGQCIQKILLEIGYLEIGLSKILRKFNFILYGISYVSKNKQELITSPFWGCQICLEVFYFVVHHLTIFDALIQRGFGVFAKMTIGNLWNPFHNVIIIPFSTFSWNHKTLGTNEKYFKNLNTWRSKEAF